MMAVIVLSISLKGIERYQVDVEVQLLPGDGDWDYERSGRYQGCYSG